MTTTPTPTVEPALDPVALVAALRKIADLRYSEAGEPDQDAWEMAANALAAFPPAAGASEVASPDLGERLREFAVEWIVKRWTIAEVAVDTYPAILADKFEHALLNFCCREARPYLDRATAAEAALVGAVETLEPFAAEASEWGEAVPDGHHPVSVEMDHWDARYYGSPAKFTVGDLRRARAFLRARAQPGQEARDAE